MKREVRLFWSAKATAEYLEGDKSVRQQIDACANLIHRFPLIGIRLAIAGAEHRRRFVCAGWQLFYDLREIDLTEASQELPEASRDQQPARVEITLRFFKRA